MIRITSATTIAFVVMILTGCGGGPSSGSTRPPGMSPGDTPSDGAVPSYDAALPPPTSDAGIPSGGSTDASTPPSDAGLSGGGSTDAGTLPSTDAGRGGGDGTDCDGGTSIPGFGCVGGGGDRDAGAVGPSPDCDGGIFFPGAGCLGSGGGGGGDSRDAGAVGPSPDCDGGIFFPGAGCLGGGGGGSDSHDAGSSAIGSSDHCDGGSFVPGFGCVSGSDSGGRNLTAARASAGRGRQRRIAPARRPPLARTRSSGGPTRDHQGVRRRPPRRRSLMGPRSPCRCRCKRPRCGTEHSPAPRTRRPPRSARRLGGSGSRSSRWRSTPGRRRDLGRYRAPSRSSRGRCTRRPRRRRCSRRRRRKSHRFRRTWPHTSWVGNRPYTSRRRRQPPCSPRGSSSNCRTCHRRARTPTRSGKRGPRRSARPSSRCNRRGCRAAPTSTSPRGPRPCMFHRARRIRPRSLPRPARHHARHPTQHHDRRVHPRPHRRRWWRLPVGAPVDFEARVPGADAGTRRPVHRRHGDVDRAMSPRLEQHLATSGGHDAAAVASPHVNARGAGWDAPEPADAAGQGASGRADGADGGGPARKLIAARRDLADLEAGERGRDGGIGRVDVDRVSRSAAPSDGEGARDEHRERARERALRYAAGRRASRPVSRRRG